MNPLSGVEIERKWLISGIDAVPDEVLAADAQEIDQGYLTIGTGGSETRVRRKSGRWTLTVKSGTGLARAEVEVELSAGQFKSLWPLTHAARVRKTRRTVPAQGGLKIELDVYAGALNGLVTAEVEFDDPWSAESFEAPYWFGREVTADEGYKNRSLALSGLPA